MTGNDLETSEVPLSVLFCIIEKNAFSECKGTINIRYEQKQRNHIWSKPSIQPLSYHNPCIRHTCGRLCV